MWSKDNIPHSRFQQGLNELRGNYLPISRNNVNRKGPPGSAKLWKLKKSSVSFLLPLIPEMEPTPGRGRSLT